MSEHLDDLLSAVFDSDTWMWMEDLQDNHGGHDWDTSLAFFVVPERRWYIVCANFDAVAAIDPSQCGVSIECQEDTEDECAQNKDNCYEKYDQFSRVLFDAEDIARFKRGIGWDD